MKTVVQALLVVTLGVMSFPKQEPAVVVKNDQDSTIKIEQVISGHLTELNGKYKLRVTETIYKPGGFIGEHHHVGPGIRYVASGQLTYIQRDKTNVYKEGNYFYESGDITHTAYNKTNAPVRVLNFEILPVAWKGSSAVPPMK
jgi:quercetin dioxygenase-like cupin family protein